MVAVLILDRSMFDTPTGEGEEEEEAEDGGGRGGKDRAAFVDVYWFAQVVGVCLLIGR